MKTCILFCCQKAAIFYMTQNKDKIKCLFQENIGRRYLIKIQVLDKELIEQYKQSLDESNLYVIDVKDDKTLTDNNEPSDNKINLNHMGVILLEEENSDNLPVLNVYNIGILCFLTCVDCKQDGCPAKSPCSKLAMDVIRLWNTMGYNPSKHNEENYKLIKSGLQTMYSQDSVLYDNIPEFVRKTIDNFE